MDKVILGTYLRWSFNFTKPAAKELVLTPWPGRLEHPKMFRYLPQSGASPLLPPARVCVIWNLTIAYGSLIAHVTKY